MNFQEMSERRQPFVATSENWSLYREWLATEARCSGCGKTFKDRQRDSNGIILDRWVCETECWSCFEERCRVARGENGEHGI